MNRIILLGFRCCGKTTIGRQIAKMNGFNFIDLDEEIEKKAKTKIKNIVQENGWKYFRKLEFQCYQEHINKDNVVISCGGGFAVNQYLQKEEIDILKTDKGLKILFEIDEKTLTERIKQSYQRPSFKDRMQNNIKQIIEENIAVYKQRKPLYNVLDYDVKIDTSNIKIVAAISKHTLCCVVGYPVWHSLSPKIHNFLYDIQDLDNFVYTKCEIKPDKITKLKEIIKIFRFRGISITSPYKKEIIKIVDVLDEKAKQIDAVNTIFIDNNGKIYGYNTDYIGVLNALEENVDLTNKKVAIFGSGGGAKSAVIACLEKTKNIVLFNRTKEKNDIFTEQNRIKSCILSDFNPKNFDIIINATIVGLNTSKSILKPNQILEKHIVFDMVYQPLKTKLLKNAISKGAKIIYGTNMLFYQAIKQHEIYTKHQIKQQELLELKNRIFQKNHNTCLVIFANTLNEMLKKIKIAQQKSDFIELRFDYIDKIDKKTIEKIAEKICVDTIVTLRSKKDGGCFEGTKLQQISLIQYAISLNKFTYFDIDFSNMNDWQNELKNKEKQYKIILSHHDFKKCLSYQNCIKIIDKMFENGADIAKIACKIIKHKDILTMLKILEKYKKADKQIIFAPMCENKIIRVLASKYGSWTNFVCLNEKENTANGQICIDDYNKIVDLLR